MPFRYRSRHRFFVVAFLFAAALPMAATATTIHVPADKATIQAAIDSAVNGDTVLVSNGTYKENIDFNGKAINVKSVNGANTTIIDGNKINYVVNFHTSEGPTSILDGFTITNGYPGGINVGGSSPTVQNNTITANTGCTGIGLNISGAPLIQNNIISNNVQAGCSGGPGGGGIEVIGSSIGAQIIGNTITGNNSGNGVNGGGIGLWTPGPVLIRGNFISGNTANNGGGIGGANDTSGVRIIENVITGNAALGTGGGIEIDNTVSLILNNTIVGNDAPGGGSAFFGAFFTATGPMTVSNNLIIGKPGQSALGCRSFDTVSPPVFSFNDVFSSGGPNYGSICIDQTGKNGNISANPLFVNPAVLDFHLQATSPGIDAGSNTAPSLPTQDIAGAPRILDGNGDCIAIVDMGAYEFAPPSVLTVVPFNLAFADQIVGSTGSLSTTITNTASTATAVCGISITGDFSQTNTCAPSIAGKGSCTVNVDFTPTAQGVRSGLLQVVTTDGGSPRSVSLTGSGTDFSISAASSGSTSATVTTGNTATYNLQISPLSGFAGTVAFACTGAPSLAVCTASPGTVTPGGSPSLFAISVTTTAASFVVPRMGPPPRMPPVGFFLIVLLLFCVFALMISLAGFISPLPQRTSAFAYSLAILLVVLVWSGGCGGSSSSGPKNLGTPKGNYSLTVIATSNGVSHPLVLSLTVN